MENKNFICEKQEKCQYKNNYVDENGDGICDNKEEGHHKGCGKGGKKIASNTSN